MISNWIGRWMPTSLIWIVALLGAVRLWFWLTNGNDVPGLLAAAALLLTAILGAVGLARALAVRRFNAALDAYAEREIDRERRRTRSPRVRGISTLGGALRVDRPTDGERPARTKNRFTRGLSLSSRPALAKGEEP